MAMRHGRIRKKSPTQQIQDNMEQIWYQIMEQKTPAHVFWCSVWAGLKPRGF